MAVRRDSRRVVGLSGLCLALLLAVPNVSQARQPDDQGSGQAVRAQEPIPGPDFFLGRPRASLGVRGNWFMARADSDIFEFVTEHLTLERSSFNAPTFGVELGINVTQRLDIVLGFDAGKSSTPSEYRALVDNNRLPIEQTTEMKEFDAFATIRYSLMPKGRSISRLAWIPRTVTPYVGAGGGLMKYTFFQTGDFVDFQTNRVFTDVFRSSGWGPSAHLLGGVDVQVYKHVFMSFEGKYMWSSGELGQKFIDFAPIDLSGARFGAGIHLVF
jgi:hypothetical protein